MEIYKNFLEKILELIRKYNISPQNLNTYANRELEKELHRLICETYEKLENIKIRTKIWD